MTTNLDFTKELYQLTEILPDYFDIVPKSYVPGNNKDYGNIQIYADNIKDFEETDIHLKVKTLVFRIKEGFDNEPHELFEFGTEFKQEALDDGFLYTHGYILKFKEVLHKYAQVERRFWKDREDLTNTDPNHPALTIDISKGNSNLSAGELFWLYSLSHFYNYHDLLSKKRLFEHFLTLAAVKCKKSKKAFFVALDEVIPSRLLASHNLATEFICQLTGKEKPKLNRFNTIKIPLTLGFRYSNKLNQNQAVRNK